MFNDFSNRNIYIFFFNFQESEGISLVSLDTMECVDLTPFAAQCAGEYWLDNIHDHDGIGSGGGGVGWGEYSPFLLSSHTYSPQLK